MCSQSPPQLREGRPLETTRRPEPRLWAAPSPDGLSEDDQYLIAAWRDALDDAASSANHRGLHRNDFGRHISSESALDCNSLQQREKIKIGGSFPQPGENLLFELQ